MLFVDATHGYAVGTSGGLLSTIDGGTTWVGHNAGTAEALTNINCVTLMACVVSTDRGDFIETTSDGFATPVTASGQPHPPSGQRRSVGVTDPGRGRRQQRRDRRLVGHRRQLHARRRRAPSLQLQPPAAGGTADSAFVVGPNGACATTNNGQSWTTRKVQGGGNVIDVSFPTPNVGGRWTRPGRCTRPATAL